MSYVTPKVTPVRGLTRDSPAIPAKSKRRLSAALHRFSEHAALYFVRAKASALLGFNASVLDDLARAVYFGRQSPFYVAAVLESPFVEEARPALWRACRSVDPVRKELAPSSKAE